MLFVLATRCSQSARQFPPSSIFEFLKHLIKIHLTTVSWRQTEIPWGEFDVLSTTPLYARMDFVRDDGEEFLVMELELIEPSMYLRTNPDGPINFARAIDHRHGSRS